MLRKLALMLALALVPSAAGCSRDEAKADSEKKKSDDDGKTKKASSKKGGADEEADGENPFVRMTDKYAKAVCACETVACAKKATEDYGKRVDEMKDEKGTEDDVKRIEKAGEKAKKCMEKLMKGSED